MSAFSWTSNLTPIVGITQPVPAPGLQFNYGQSHVLWTFGITILACVVLWGFLSLFNSGRFNPLQLIMGVDGRPSSSKFQVVLWTVVLIFAYIAIFVARTAQGEINPSVPIPGDLLILAGLSIGTAGAAKVITQRGVANRAITTKIPLTERVSDGNPDIPPTPTTGGLLKDDSGQTDIGKFQLISWTLIATGIFLVTLYERVAQYFGVITPQTPSLLFPTIDQTLLALLIVNHGVYLGTKLAPIYTPDTSPNPKVGAVRMNAAARDGLRTPDPAAQVSNGAAPASPAAAANAPWETLA